ncbi:hypothetical protein ABID14_000968 [Peptoniphilus olsenii]|uniref:SLH domain-containing protein n=1 Tax=Peptoniphilus olsenii TaxID=411570 RepID=A0ABV2J986_9FIRM
MNKKKILTFNLALTLMILPTNIFAKEFKDVKPHGRVSWAYKYIDELSNKKILNGYEDGKFKPNNAVSFLETMQIIKTTLNPSDAYLKEAINKNLEFLNANSVPEWARGAVAFNIEHKTITAKTLEQAKKGGFIDSKVYPSRNSIAVYFARALKFSKNADASNLNYKDKNKIAPLTFSYLPELVNANIFTSTGSEGYFNGNKAIRRSEMAVITSKTLSWSEANKNNIINPNNKVEVDNLIPEESGDLNENVDELNKPTQPVQDNISDEDLSGDSIINDTINENTESEEKIEENKTVNFTGEVMEVTEAGTVRYLKIRIIDSDNSNYSSGSLITINANRHYNIGDRVSGSGTLGKNSLLDIKLN